MSVTTPCVSPSTGALGPDLRVNYAYGMVLGVDEFLQEQMHRLSHSWLHERALHGYGTVSGLAVSTTAVSGAHDYTVKVSAGIAVDQFGREIVIRSDQCARIGAWLAVQEQASPGVIARHLGVSGELTLYVVVSYAECLDALVPIPGQPCSSSEQSMVPSRVRDAWDVEFSWDPPPMPRWDSDRRLARLLAAVKIVAGLDPAHSDEDAIIAAVSDLALQAHHGPSDLGPDFNPSMPPWRLPAEDAADALDRILTEWVTKVRPELEPDLIDLPAAGAAGAPDPTPAVLLSTVTFVPAHPFNPAAPVIVACDQPDDYDRPYLLHTQLIQELHRLGEAATAAARDRTVATLSAIIGDGPTFIDAWFHIGAVKLPNTVTVTDENGGQNAFTAAAVKPDANGFSARWTLTGRVGPDGVLIAVHLPLSTVLVGNTTTTLAAIAGEGLLDCDANEAVVYGQVAFAPPPPPAQHIFPSSELVTMFSELNSDHQLTIEMWFHPQPRGQAVDQIVVAKPVLQVVDDTTGAQLALHVTGPAPWSGNVWRVVIANAQSHPNQPVYLRVIFDAKQTQLREKNAATTVSLADWIAEIVPNFVGWEEALAQIVTFLRNPGVVTQPPTLPPFPGGQ